MRKLAGTFGCVIAIAVGALGACQAPELPAAADGSMDLRDAAMPDAAVADLAVPDAARPPPPVIAVATQHNDNNRTGATLEETVLTADNVNPERFGKLFVRQVQGAIYAQPLYLSGVDVPGKGRRNVVYVATMHDLVYAFDADDPDAGEPLWGPVSLGPPVTLPDPNVGVRNYRDIAIEIGILSTPVLAPQRNALYLVAMTLEGGHHYHSLHMLDLRSGAALRPPVRIEGSVPGSGDGSQMGSVPFLSHRQNQRAGLLLSGDRIYIAFAAFADKGPYHGWVFAYDAVTLERRAIYNTTPDGRQGGVWQSGQGLAGDERGNVYFLTGNGSFKDDGSALGDSAVKLTPDLALQDWFSPYDNALLDARDWDLGSGGVLLIPDTGFLLGGGKEGKLYLLDRDNLGHIGAGNDDQIVQSFSLAADAGRHIHGGPVYWQGPDGGQVYVWTERDYLKSYRLADGMLDPEPVSRSAEMGVAGMPGGFLSISAHGSDRKSGIVWASHPHDGDANQKVVEGTLRAFDATDLSVELWNSRQNAERDVVGKYAKFSPPTIAGGKVYLSTFGGIEDRSTLPDTALEAPALVNCNDAALTVAWTGSAGDHAIAVRAAPDGVRFGMPLRPGGSSLHGPALAGGGGRAFLAWTTADEDQHLSVAQAADCATFGGAVTLDDTSPFGPALAYGDGKLYLAWTGFGGGALNVMSSTDGATFGDKVTLTETSPYGPALLFSDGKLYLLWTGFDGNHSLNVLESGDGTTFKNKATAGEGSSGRPAAAAPNYLAWAGKDPQQSLSFMTFRTDAFGGVFGSTTSYGAGSPSGFALAPFRNRLYLAWSGAGAPAHVKLATLSFGSLAVYGLLPN